MDCLGVSHTLTAEIIETAYRRGLFPMGTNGGNAVSWHLPRRRGILPLDRLHASRSLRRLMTRGGYSVTVDKAFDGVMRRCAGRKEGSWITAPILDAYGALHRRGQAHSLEVWLGEELAGGIYGVHFGGAFFAESMFHAVRDMSKVALVSLVERLRTRGFLLLDVQYATPHLARFGAIEISHREYQALLGEALSIDCRF